MTALEPRASSDRAWARAKLLAALLGVIAFANVPLNGYCYDDRLIVETSRRVGGERPWREIWFTDYWSEARGDSPRRDLLYRPVSVSTFRLVHAVAGPSPSAHHVVNVALHACICIGLVTLGRRIGVSPTAGLIGGALFAVLPIHTDVVATVVGRCDLLAAGGTLAAILLHRRASESSTHGARFASRAASGFVAFLAMAAKENAVTVVVLIPLLDLSRPLCDERPTPVWHRFSTGANTGCKPVPHFIQQIRSVFRYCPLVIAMGAYLALRYVALDGRFVADPPISRSVNVLVDASAWQHALGVAQLWGMYWAKTIWPSVLSIGYSINTIRLATSPTNPHVLIGLSALAAMAIVSARALRRGNRVPLLLSACVIIAYLPTANALVPLQVFFAERIWYGPSIWLALLVGAITAEWMRDRFEPIPITPLPLRERSRGEGFWDRVLARRARSALYIAAYVLCGAMVVRCWVRNLDWRDEGRLFAAAVRDQPEGVAVLQLYGQYLANEGRFAEAIPLLERARYIDVGFTDAYTTLAQAQIGLKRFDEAMRTLSIVEQQFPGAERTRRMVSEAKAGLAASAGSAGSADPGVASLRDRVQSQPGDLGAELALIRALRERGLGREAIERSRTPRPEFEDAPAWRYECAVTLAMLGARNDAIDAYGRVLKIDEGNTQARVELAMLLLERRAPGDLEQADSELRPAEAAAPNAPNVLAARAEWFAAQGRVFDAIAAYRRAVSILPPTSPQRTLFEQRMRSLGG